MGDGSLRNLEMSEKRFLMLLSIIKGYVQIRGNSAGKHVNSK